MKFKLVWISALIGIVVAFAAVSVASAQAAEDPAKVAAGEAVFTSAGCVGCHGADGAGVEGRGRPLIGIAAQQPDRTVHITSVTNGKGGMPAWGDQLSADEIDSAVAYVRATFVSDSDDLAQTGSETNVLLLAGAALMAFGLVAGRSRFARN
jgi:LPXTG-motif cell wall-anchored protein